MKSIFDPSVFFISEEEWKNEEKRDDFIEYFTETFEIINSHPITNVVWTDDLDELMNDRYSPPWIADRDWSNRIIPILYKFDSLKLRLTNEKNLKLCQINPNLGNLHGQLEINNKFLELVHILIDSSEKNVLFCLGICNHPAPQLGYLFFCDCHDCTISPRLITHPNEWLAYLNIPETYWPLHKTDKRIFMIALSLFIQQEYNQKISDFPNKVEYSEQFVDSLVNEVKHREAILDSLARRLSIIQKQATQNKSLKDEPIKGKKRKKGEIERRFRVTGECRIHYKYSSNGTIVLLRYYGEGQHDTGLRKS